MVEGAMMIPYFTTPMIDLAMGVAEIGGLVICWKRGKPIHFRKAWSRDDPPATLPRKDPRV